jgi:hypothetical protein
MLQVNRVLGDVPRERRVQRIRLSFQSSVSEFSEEVSGRVMFRSMPPEVSSPVKTPQQEPAPDLAAPPSSLGQESVM